MITALDSLSNLSVAGTCECVNAAHSSSKSLETDVQCTLWDTVISEAMETYAMIDPQQIYKIFKRKKTSLVCQIGVWCWAEVFSGWIYFNFLLKILHGSDVIKEGQKTKADRSLRTKP